MLVMLLKLGSLSDMKQTIKLLLFSIFTDYLIPHRPPPYFLLLLLILVSQLYLSYYLFHVLMCLINYISILSHLVHPSLIFIFVFIFVLVFLLVSHLIILTVEYYLIMSQLLIQLHVVNVEIMVLAQVVCIIIQSVIHILFIKNHQSLLAMLNIKISRNLSRYYLLPTQKMNVIPRSPHDDSLDHATQQYTRVKSGYSSQNDPYSYRHDVMLKKIYKQDLDNIIDQRNEQKRVQKQRLQQQRQKYNERANYSQEAEKMKDLAYKNYYQILLNNQVNIAKNHTQLNYERDNLKDQLIKNGIEEQKIRSDQWWQAEQQRRQNMKKHYRQGLDKQLNQKYSRSAQEIEAKTKHQDQMKKITMTPQQVAKYERERRMTEKIKYKEDLDRSTPFGTQKYRQIAGSSIVSNSSFISQNNDFNINQERRHDPMINPMPYNIQNPYILRQFMRREGKAGSQANIFASKE